MRAGRAIMTSDRVVAGYCPCHPIRFILHLSKRELAVASTSHNPAMGAAPPADGFDPIEVQREAAMFYGLFLRGHPPEELRRDIAIPKQMFLKWLSHPHYDGQFRENAKRIYRFRRQVLAVFDELVDRARMKERLQ